MRNKLNNLVEKSLKGKLMNFDYVVGESIFLEILHNEKFGRTGNDVNIEDWRPRPRDLNRISFKEILEIYPMNELN
jgi:hypothetical protein